MNLKLPWFHECKTCENLYDDKVKTNFPDSYVNTPDHPRLLTYLMLKYVFIIKSSKQEGSLT